MEPPRGCSQVEPYLGEPLPPRNVCAIKRQQTAAHSCPTDVKSLRDGVGILLGKEEATGVRAVSLIEPPRQCESLGDGL